MSFYSDFKSLEDDYNGRIEFIEEELKKHPEDAEILNRLAHIYACCLIDTCRNGERALELASKACELTNYKNDYFVSVLAAAYAECGNFKQAIEYQQKGKQLFHESLDGSGHFWGIPPSHDEALDSYRKKKPWREEM
jgi:tetratricopeptide (TPR) repeat protein